MVRIPSPFPLSVMVNIGSKLFITYPQGTVVTSVTGFSAPEAS